MSFDALLDKTCTITRATEAASAFGVTKTFGAHLSGVACRISQVSAQDLFRETDGASNLVATHKAWLPFGTDIATGDRLASGGVTYEVTQPDADVAGSGHHVKALLLEVRG